MSDLIRREDALAYPIRIDHYDREHGDLHFVLGIESVMEYIENLPSAEVVLQTPQTYGKSINPSNAEVVADYISRTDAIEAVADRIYDDLCYMYCNNCRYDSEIGEDDPRWSCYDCYRKYNSWGISSAVAKGIAEHALNALPSALCDDCIWTVCNYNKVDWDAPSAEAEQVTGKLKNPCDSLLTDDSDECKEQKSKLEAAEAVQRGKRGRGMTREEALDILTHNWTRVENPNYDESELDKAYCMAIEALKAEPIRCGECENYIDRRCIEANHHVAAHGNCMNVFGAKRREL